MTATQHGDCMGPEITGLVRPRLIPAGEGTSNTRLGLVIAPPGTGKTTLLAHWAARRSTTVAWYRSSPGDSKPGRMLARFASALASALDEEFPRTFPELELLARRLDEPLVFVVDDLHALAHTSAESELERLLTLNSPLVYFLVGSRRPPFFNLARSELPAAVTVCGDDLRFRPSEVDQLFRTTYKQPLTSAGALNLTLRTDGWAAALHLFHLATKNRSSVERRRAAESFGPASRHVQDYLTHHFLAGVSEDMELLLRRSCLFDVLTPSRCDALLEGSDSRPLLHRLEQLGVLSREDDGATLRVPELLRQYLVATVDARHADRDGGTLERTATILEREGAFGPALGVLAQGKDWGKVRNLLQRARKNAVQPGACGWAALIPAPLLREDAGYAVAAARQLLDDGCLAAAHRTAAEVPALTSDPEWLALALDLQLTAARWGGNAGVEGPGPAGSLREAARGNPGRAARSMRVPYRPQELLAQGLSFLLGGDQRSALDRLRQCTGRLADEPGPALAAQLALAVFGPETSAWDLDAPAAEVDAVQRQAERRGFTWLARLARGVQAALSGTSSCQESVRSIVDSCQQRGDEWGAALVAAAAALMRLRAGRPDVRGFEALAGRFRRLDAGALEAWAQSAQALVSATLDLPGAAEEARTAEAFARAAGVPGAHAVAYAAMALQWPEHHGELMCAARETGASAGLMCRPWTWIAPEPRARASQRALTQVSAIGPADSAGRTPGGTAVEVVAGAPQPSLQVGCFGGFTLRNDGAAVDLSRVRPQARTVLRILSLNAGRPVHRERLAGILWADLDTPAALHALQVSVSSLRGALQTGCQAEGQQLLVRQGEAYALVLASGSAFDLADFDQTLHAASRARSVGDHPSAAEELRRALELYTGEVLPEDGPAEWVADTRERYRLRAAEAAASLAGLELVLGNPANAAAAATRSVEIDPWRDESWRTLVETFRRLGDPAAAERAQRRYELILNSLGVPASSGPLGPAEPLGQASGIATGRRTGPPLQTRVPPPDPSIPGY
ncbi:DNA-binding SARP family transcriptional activator [Arthrobacter sp. V4I6]|uniref:BTAD domain-containing putative transcriptional regulator n=1 Tax=unclassified Arthrobacter TaxID=235627 RepID=UPI0027833B4D|nr:MULTISPECIES: BTAD domain-containing putative transcriptional regulator [unclassified Arthrobacter]MDQ0821170.1 DNA-binding SARP family transcriptional activator [Arthrobacter sp. V1I7]MDQ0855433.1 DNA-binding SARP family transcriptional activator [Arthrobacter sp. V4I6]